MTTDFFALPERQPRLAVMGVIGYVVTQIAAVILPLA